MVFLFLQVLIAVYGSVKVHFSLKYVIIETKSKTLKGLGRVWAQKIDFYEKIVFLNFEQAKILIGWADFKKLLRIILL